MELAIGSIVYSCTFLKEINCDWFRGFVNGPGDLSSILGLIILKTKK